MFRGATSNLSDDFDISDFLLTENLEPEHIKRCEFWVKANAQVRRSGNLNYLNSKIQVNNIWNFDYLEEALRDYPEKSFILDMFKYGWPLNNEATEASEPHTSKSKRAPGTI